MKTAVFIVIALITYAASGYVIPGWRIEFAAEGNELLYFWELLQTGIIPKLLLSLVTASVITGILHLICKKKSC